MPENDPDAQSIAGRLERAQRIATQWADRNEDANTLDAELGSIAADLREQDQARRLSAIAGLETATLIAVRCSICDDGAPFAPDGIGYACAESEDAAIAIVTDAGGLILNDAVICPGCVVDEGIGTPTDPMDAPAVPHDASTARVIPPQ